jgi:hypothetical protein
MHDGVAHFERPLRGRLCFSGSCSLTLRNADLDAVSLLRNEGIAYAPIGDYLEISPLGRAEWIKFTSAFFNREAEANAFFSKIEGVYR